jgi:hypothetical protein
MMGLGRERIRHLSAACTLAAFVCLGGCSPRPGDVEIRLSLDGMAGTPAGATIMALPYDAGAILDSLTRAADRPPPRFPELEQELTEYRRHIPPELNELYRDWATARRAVEALSDSLVELDREVPSYEPTYRRFRDRYAELAHQEADLERAMRELSAEDRALAQEATSAADSLRQWEDEAYADYDAIATDRISQSGRNEVRLTTEPSGRASARLDPGRWWLVARVPHPENPFQEYYWSVALKVDGLTPLRIPLSDRNVTLRWRH